MPKFIAAPSRLQAQVHCHAIKVASSFLSRAVEVARSVHCRAFKPIAHPQSFQRAGESHRRTAIFSTGRQIPSPGHHLFRRQANLIAMPQSFQRAGKPNRFRGPAHSIAKPPNLISSGASSSCLLYHNSIALSLNCASINLLYLNLF